jgi:hypothetical protein
VHLIANYLPDGKSVSSVPVPTYLRAAGIMQPFGGGDPTDPRLRLYNASYAPMMADARSPLCQAARAIELRTKIDVRSPLPVWADLVGDYRRENGCEVYTTAAFDPPGLMRFWWEDLLFRHTGRFTFECRNLCEQELKCLSEGRPPDGFSKVAVCVGYEGFRTLEPNGGEYPILGVLVHFRGDGETICWMDEGAPPGTSGQRNEPDCLYAIRRPLYLGNEKEDPAGRIVLGGTLKADVDSLPPAELETVVKAIIDGVNATFGERFTRGSVIDVTQCRRPGHRGGFQIGVNANRSYAWIRGQAGMGIVTAHGSGSEIAAKLFS